MNTFFCCPKCGEELEVRTTTPPTPGELIHCDTCGTIYNRGDRHRSRNGDYCITVPTEPDPIPLKLSDELKEYIEERDNEMLNEFAKEWDENADA